MALFKSRSINFLGIASALMLSSCVQTQQYMEQRHYSKALEQLEQQMTETSPGDKKSFNNHLDLCTVYRKMGEPETALEHGKQALAISPDDNKALEQVAYAYLDLGDYDQAIVFGDKVIKNLDKRKSKLANVYVSYNEAYYDLDYFFRKSKRSEEARDYFTTRLKTYPDGVPEKRFYVSGLLLAGQFAEADAFLTSEHNTKLYYYAGLEMSWINDYSQALVYMKQSASTHKPTVKNDFPSLKLINRKIEHFESREYLVNQKWPEYLKTIEEVGLTENWVKPPYSELISRRPYNK